MTDPQDPLADLRPCEDGSPNHVWRWTELSCETCGDHSGYVCDECWTIVDHVWNPYAYDAIAEKIGEP